MVEKRRMSTRVFNVLKYVALVISALFALIPVCVCVLTAFKTNDEYNTTSPLQLPKSFFYFENFIVAFQKANMLRCFFNTALVLVVVVTASILIGSMLAYVLSRFSFKGNAVIHNLFMFAALIPGIATQVTVYQIMYSLKLINHK